MKKHMLHVVLFLGLLTYQGNSLLSAPLTAQYIPSNEDSTRQALSTYDSVPSGVLLEGRATGLGEIHTVQYDVSKNLFLINEEYQYQPPVSSREMQMILNAIAQDERMGFSVEKKERVLGAYPLRSRLAGNLKLTDYILGYIAFGYVEGLPGALVREGANLKKKEASEDRDAMAISFYFEDYNFQTSGSVIKLKSSQLRMTLTSLRERNERYIPTFEFEEIPEEYKANLRHLTENMDYYRKLPWINASVQYGEAAAFARTLKSCGFDLNQL